MRYENKKLRDLCRNQPCAVMLYQVCTGGGEDTVAAHSNLGQHGKGMSIKAHDVFTFPCCAACHRELDQGFTMNRAGKGEAIAAALDRWHLRMWRDGLVKVAA